MNDTKMAVLIMKTDKTLVQRTFGGLIPGFIL